MSEKLQRFTDLMKQVFELDKSDLDFGIYRIMNIRKAEIEKFLTEGLPEKVRDTLAPLLREIRMRSKRAWRR
jgi:adenine-specific DNA-methyltransferase